MSRRHEAEDMSARVSLASINLFVHAPQTRRSKNGLRASTALYPRAPGLRAAKRSLASPHQEMHPKRIPAQQTRSRRLNKLSATSGCSERIKLSDAGGVLVAFSSSRSHLRCLVPTDFPVSTQMAPVVCQ